MNPISILPSHYDVDFIVKQAGVTNHFGYPAQDDGIHFRYRVEDYDAVQTAIDAYPVAYRAVEVPKLIHVVSRTREQKLAAFVFNGMAVPLDTVTIANLTASTVGLTRDVNRAAINWSLGKGVSLTIPRAVMLALADAAFAYVNDCFDAQKVIVEEIQSASDIEALRLIDVAGHEAWPA